MLCTSNGVRVLPGLVAMGFHAIPWECAFAGRMATERRPLKPLPVGGAKAAARDVLLQLKLYQLFCHIVGGVITPPCGVPSSVGANSIPSITPAFSHPFTSRLIAGVVLSFASRASWLM